MLKTNRKQIPLPRLRDRDDILADLSSATWDSTSEFSQNKPIKLLKTLGSVPKSDKTIPISDTCGPFARTPPELAPMQSGAPLSVQRQAVDATTAPALTRSIWPPLRRFHVGILSKRTQQVIENIMEFPKIGQNDPNSGHLWPCSPDPAGACPDAIGGSRGRSTNKPQTQHRRLRYLARPI